MPAATGRLSTPNTMIMAFASGAPSASYAVTLTTNVTTARTPATASHLICWRSCAAPRRKRMATDHAEATTATSSAR